jgi:hypothetical protein
MKPVNKRNHTETKVYVPSTLHFWFWCCGRYDFKGLGHSYKSFKLNNEDVIL